VKLLFVADMHTKAHYARLLDKKPDAVICAGDVTNFRRGDYTALAPIISAGIPMFFTTGNHETDSSGFDLAESRPGEFFCINERVVLFRDTLLYGIGGEDSGILHGHRGHAVDVRLSLLRERLANAPTALTRIFVTHEPPRGNATLNGKRVVVHGNPVLTEFILETKPDFVVYGHIHALWGAEGKIGEAITINPGPKGRIIESLRMPVGS